MDSLGGFKPNPALHIMDEHPGMGAISFSPARVEAEGRSLSPVVSGSSGSWEEAVGGATEKLADHLVRRYHARKCDETTEQARDLVTVVLRAAWPEGERDG
jgi:hypothetical protein